MFLKLFRYNKLAFFSSLTVPVAGYIYWKLCHSSKPTRPDKRKRKLRHCVPGLINAGNTCFMNSLLQCAASAAPFMRWLERTSDVHRVEGRALLAETLSNLLHVISGDEDVVDPSYLLRYLASRGWHISCDEHDVHEFFHCIISTLDDEINQLNSDISLSSINKLCKGHLSSNAFNGRVVSSVVKDNLSCFCLRMPKKHSFHGSLSVRLRCLQCGNQNPVTYESFDSLSLPIGAYNRRTLLDCLMSYLACEVLNKVECFRCTEKKRKNQSVCNNTLSSMKASSGDWNKTGDASPRNHLSTLPLVVSELEEKLSHGLPPLPLRPASVAKPETASFYKFSHLSKLPRCLCIHLQRLVWKCGQPTKLSHHVSFPEVLDVGQCVFKHDKKKQKKVSASSLSPIFLSITNSRPQRSLKLELSTSFIRRNGATTCKPVPAFPSTNKHLYQLTGAIIHIGDWRFSGHFVAYRRHILKDGADNESVQWFYTSDAVVKKVSIQDVLCQPAYMLFYEKIL